MDLFFPCMYASMRWKAVLNLSRDVAPVASTSATTKESYLRVMNRHGSWATSKASIGEAEIQGLLASGIVDCAYYLLPGGEADEWMT